MSLLTTLSLFYLIVVLNNLALIHCRTKVGTDEQISK
jgi:hypothetical protein